MKQGALLAILRLGVLLLAAPAALAATQVRNVALEAQSSGSARFTLTLSGPPSHQVFTLDNPKRVVIDLKSTSLPRSMAMPAVGGPVASMRSGKQPGGRLRFVLEMGAGYTTMQARASGNQLILDLGMMPAVAAPPAPPAPPKPVQAAHAPADLGRDIVIAVDAGHGGQDPGASGAAGTREKDVVLAIARALAKRIDAEPGMKAVLTRDSDVYIAHRERMNIARRARADIFISVHADAIQNRGVTGSSVYVLSTRGASSEAARWLAEEQNAADLKGGVSLGDKDDALASVLIDLTQTASIGGSMEAAERVLGQLDLVGTVRKTKVQQAAFLVLKSPDIPSMLVETAYISNPGEEKKLRTASHQTEVAEAIFNGVREYFRQSPPDGTLFARQRESRRGTGPILAGGTGP
jgi:N-acetylmuramoyl-L-alanine amidase